MSLAECALHNRLRHLKGKNGTWRKRERPVCVEFTHQDQAAVGSDAGTLEIDLERGVEGEIKGLILYPTPLGTGLRKRLQAALRKEEHTQKEGGPEAAPSSCRCDLLLLPVTAGPSSDGQDMGVALSSRIGLGRE